MSNGTTTWNYTYDSNGMRTSLSNGSTTYNYVYNGSQLTQMTVGNDTLYSIYDATGTPVNVVWNDIVYYRVTTLQSDVLLVRDEDGEIVVSYDYNAWAICLMWPEPWRTPWARCLLRYRSYVYDQESGNYHQDTFCCPIGLRRHTLLQNAFQFITIRAC